MFHNLKDKWYCEKTFKRIYFIGLKFRRIHEITTYSWQQNFEDLQMTQTFVSVNQMSLVQVSQSIQNVYWLRKDIFTVLILKTSLAATK